MRLFLDSSVLLAACGSTKGASHEIFRQVRVHGWTLIATPYVIGEVLNNLGDFPRGAAAQWARLRADLLVLDDVLTLDRPVVFTAAKDRPILFGALAWADVLLTRDTGDFSELLGGSIYELLVLTPGDFLQRERRAGRCSDGPKAWGALAQYLEDRAELNPSFVESIERGKADLKAGPVSIEKH